MYQLVLALCAVPVVGEMTPREPCIFETVPGVFDSLGECTAAPRDSVDLMEALTSAHNRFPSQAFPKRFSELWSCRVSVDVQNAKSLRDSIFNHLSETISGEAKDLVADPGPPPTASGIFVGQGGQIIDLTVTIDVHK